MTGAGTIAYYVSCLTALLLISSIIVVMRQARFVTYCLFAFSLLVVMALLDGTIASLVSDVATQSDRWPLVGGSVSASVGFFLIWFHTDPASAWARLRKPALGIESVGCALRGRPSWDQFDDLTTMATRDAAAMLWERTDLRPSDVDVAECYDGFSFIALSWLEELGFCGRGEGGAFVEGGARIALDGEIPLNTHGGQLSAGRLHGYCFLHEACVQLWGEGGERQVPGDPRIAVAAAGGGPLGGALLLARR